MMNACNWKPSTVTLVDGTQVLSDSEEWRAECEARHILNLDNIGERHKMLDMIEKRRGQPARKDLEVRILYLWNKRRGAA